MTVSELKRLLKKHGCYKAEDGTNHEIWYSPITNKHFTVPRHTTQDVGKPLLGKIKQQAGIK